MATVEVLTLDGEIASVRKDYKTILAEARAELAYVREHSEAYRRWHLSGLARLGQPAAVPTGPSDAAGQGAPASTGPSGAGRPAATAVAPAGQAA